MAEPKQERTTVLVDGMLVGTAVISMSNKIEKRDPLLVGRFAPDLFTSVPFEATIIVDAPAYGMLIPENHYTVVTTINYSSWQRRCTSFSQRARCLHDGLIWTFRKRVLRRKLLEQAVTTVPNCKLIGIDERKISDNEV